MDWNKLTPEEKIKRLCEQIEEMQRTQAAVEHFERVTRQWLEQVQAAWRRQA
jgi:hypothetical protein